MTKRSVLLAVLLTALAGAYGYAQQFGTEPAKLQVVKLADDLFVIHNDFVPGNTTALVTTAGVILVDDVVFRKIRVPRHDAANEAGPCPDSPLMSVYVGLIAFEHFLLEGEDRGLSYAFRHGPHHPP